MVENATTILEALSNDLGHPIINDLSDSVTFLHRLADSGTTPSPNPRPSPPLICSLSRRRVQRAAFNYGAVNS